MDNKLELENYLLVLKSTVEVYVHGTLESSNKEIKDLLKSCLVDTLNCQEHTYNKLTAMGAYNVNNVDTQTINQTLMSIQNNN